MTTIPTYRSTSATLHTGLLPVLHTGLLPVLHAGVPSVLIIGLLPVLHTGLIPVLHTELPSVLLIGLLPVLQSTYRTTTSHTYRTTIFLILNFTEAFLLYTYSYTVHTINLYAYNGGTRYLINPLCIHSFGVYIYIDVRMYIYASSAGLYVWHSWHLSCTNMGL